MINVVHGHTTLRIVRKFSSARVEQFLLLVVEDVLKTERCQYDSFVTTRRYRTLFHLLYESEIERRKN